LTIYKRGQGVEYGTRKKYTSQCLSFSEVTDIFTWKPASEAWAGIIGRPAVHDAPSFLTYPPEPLKKWTS